ncbi:MAG: peptidoglycan-binding protein, partial [Sediminibacterium sp.]
MRKGLLGFILLSLLFGSCKYFKSKKVVTRDTTINKKTSFNNLFFDSSHIDAFLTQNPQYEPFSEQLKDFYTHRNYQYAWFDTSGLAEQAQSFLNLQNNYINDYADSSLFNASLQQLVDTLDAQKIKPSLSNPQVIQTELLLTGQFFQYAAKMYKGSDIDAAQLGWFIPRKKIDLTALLDSTLQSKRMETDQYAPLNSQYKKLQEQLSKYLALEKQDFTDTIVSVTKPIKKGDSTFSITQIKQRLQAFGDMEPGDTSEKFDSTMLDAVKHFQKRMGLSVDGAIGSKMIAELNISVSKRIRQLLVNMERARWMPAEKDTNYILVNIPEYKMHVYDSGRLMFDMNVIVGSAVNNTVIFTGNLKYVVFSPYW